MQIRKNKQTAAGPAPVTKQAAEEGLAWAAGTEQFRHRDPLYHVTENFQQTFDRIGRSHARALVGGFLPEEEEEKDERGDQPREGRDEGGAKELQDAEDREKRLRTGNASNALTRFSDIAFQRGAMSASVLNGTGKMMLVSCLKRTVGESGPKRTQEQDLLETGSQIRNIPGRSPDRMVFNRGFARGALGIVVDTVRDARRVVDSMADMAAGTGELEAGDSGALRTMYPFLDISRDLALEAEYREKLAACTDPAEKPILQNALVTVLSLKAKKAQMKNEFINKLRFISDRATETLAELEAPGALEEIQASVWGGREPDLPENPEEGAGDDAPDGSKNRTGQTGGAGPGADGAEAEP
jgi:hypothetical protein